MNEVQKLRKIISQLDTLMILDLPLSKYPKLWDDVIEVIKQREIDIWELGEGE